MTYKILLMGPQGSGKGTQAEILAEHYGIPALSTGQLIRDEIDLNSELGQRLKQIILRGELISNIDAAYLLKSRLEKPDAQNGYVLDGYPRNMSQLEAFTFDEPTHVIVIEIPEEESMKRIGSRLTCRGCGKVSALRDGLKPGDTCKTCGGEWFIREDDKPEAIKRRLEIYRNDTEPVIQRYGEFVLRIDGMGSIEEVTKRILSAVEK